MANCLLDECRKQALYYLVFGCLNQHVADTRTCRDHLTTMKKLAAQNKWQCGDCPEKITSGMYRLITSKARTLVTRQLDGTVVSATPNPDHHPDHPETAVDNTRSVDWSDFTARHKHVIDEIMYDDWDALKRYP